jgi:uncharacterized membrane protein
MNRSVRPAPSAIAAALASALASSLALAHQPGPAPQGQERCYGVAKAGENHCANLRGTHDCAGQATKDFAVDEWKLVPAGTCRQLKGYSEAEARRRLELPKA